MEDELEEITVDMERMRRIRQAVRNQSGYGVSLSVQFPLREFLPTTIIRSLTPAHNFRRFLDGRIIHCAIDRATEQRDRTVILVTGKIVPRNDNGDLDATKAFTFQIESVKGGYLMKFPASKTGNEKP